MISSKLERPLKTREVLEICHFRDVTYKWTTDPEEDSGIDKGHLEKIEEPE